MPEVVRTNLLSPRWRYLWASVPFIHLDYKDFVNGGDNLEKRKIDQNRLQKFGDQLLLLRDGTLPLDEARIFIKCGCLYDNCCTWIRHAIRHKARMLHVYAPRDTKVMFDNRAMVPSQHLKTMRLETVYVDDRFFKALNFESHVLEHLELESCTIYVAGQKISSSSLKILSISRCHLYRDLEICAVNLNHLSILDPTFESPRGSVIVTRDLCSLVTAWISLRSGVHGDRDEILDYGILDGLSHVTTLELHAALPEVCFLFRFFSVHIHPGLAGCCRLRC